MIKYHDGDGLVLVHDVESFIAVSKIMYKAMSKLKYSDTKDKDKKKLWKEWYDTRAFIHKQALCIEHLITLYPDHDIEFSMFITDFFTVQIPALGSIKAHLVNNKLKFYVYT